MSKYKLINNKTKEETICSLVTIDGFNYYVSEGKIKINDPITDNYRVWFWRDDCSLLGRKKVLCTNNPNIDIPKVIDINIMDTLAKNTTKEQKFANGLHEKVVAEIYFRKGYNKAKETYKFTEENMVEFGLFCANFALSDEDIEDKTRKELLDIWKEQQPKKIYYGND